MSNPPCHIPMQSFDVWRSSGSDTSFQVVKIGDGPILDHSKRSRFRKGGPFIDSLPLHIKNWYVNFGAYIHCSYDHEDGCETDPDEVFDEDEKPDNTVMYSPRPKRVCLQQAVEMSPKWYSMPEEEKPEVKTPLAEQAQQEHVEDPAPVIDVKQEPKTEEE